MFLINHSCLKHYPVKVTLNRLYCMCNDSFSSATVVNVLVPLQAGCEFSEGLEKM